MTDPIVDLRSDTVTRPTPAMRRAMAEAEVGDDVFEEDPTVRRLEARGAELLGFEAALFTPTGTMGNQVALHVHCRPGREVIVEARSHVFNYEMAAMAALSGLLPRPVPTPDGLMTPEQVDAAVMPDVSYRPETALVALENTHNMAGGKVMPVERTRAILEVARRRKLPAHLDGARIFNAAAFLGRPARELAEGFDSVMFCVSKGLGAPVGSLLCGSAPFIRRARKVRKMFGGGMRQVGVLAAAGLVALDTMVDRLAEDHVAARRLAEGIRPVPGVGIPELPETNILIFRVGPEWFGGEPPAGGTSGPFLARMKERGILAVPVDAERVRFVTHYDLPTDGIDRAIAAVAARG